MSLLNTLLGMAQGIGAGGGISEAGGLPQVPPPVADEGLAVTALKPTKRNLLGKIADGVLMAYGQKPVYEGRMRERDLQNAMEGFTQDPLNAIRRIGQIPGQQGAAWNLYNQNQDNVRGDVGAESLAETRRAKFYPRIGGLLHAIQKAKDPAAAYQNALPMLRKLQERAGDTEGLPETYDPEAVSNYIGMNIDPEDQIKQEALDAYRSQRLGQMQERLEQTVAATNNLIEHRDQSRAERARHNQVTEGQGQQRINNRSGASNAAGRAVRDPEGNVVGMVDKTGRVAKLAAPDGGVQYFEVLPNGKLGRRIPDQLIKEKGKK